MDKEEYNERISRIIWHDAFQRSIIPFSWGIDLKNIRVIENGTEFTTIKGKVRIRYIKGKELFKVSIIQDSNEVGRTATEYTDIKKLVSVIDEKLKCHEPVEHDIAV